ncbi:ornithine decarboxylase 2-like isoform X3 [Andrena cerasifolii]|uniref:ornithine decarboxylase 2-like isoform X3 n=1 Tax=Andrena cerasifolii TaxID=2819439 RepID=UPI0040380A95
MSPLNFDNVILCEDTANDDDIIKTIIDMENNQEPFCILDVANVIQKHQDWIEKMPKVVPYYAIKCNSDPTVIKVLAATNAGFDCASKNEIREVMKYGVSAERIIFAHPAKLPSHIKYAKKMNVEMMTADSESELVKISELFPEAKVVIRIRCDAKVTPLCLGSKFGCNPTEDAVHLIHLTKSLGLTLHGFSFHVGSPCGEVNAYSRGISMCKRLINIARTIGCNDVQLIDIGGGFPGDSDCEIDKFASVINNAIQDIDPTIQIISEPGQYYVASAFTLASYVHTKKFVPMGEKMIRMYYMNCGVYNSFIDELLNLKTRLPIPLHEPTSNEKFLSILWGPTLDSTDCVLKNALLPEFNVGDWLIFKDMGAYSISFTFPYNGYMAPTVYPFVRKTQWKTIIERMNLEHNRTEPQISY